MTCLTSIAKSLLSSLVQDDINLQLNKINSSSDWSQLILKTIPDKLEMSQYDYKDIINRNKVWEDLCKISVDMWRDFDFYQQFMFKSRYDNEEYRSTLKESGFEFKDGTWRCVRKPKMKDVQMTVLIYYLHRQILMEKKKECTIDNTKKESKNGKGYSVYRPNELRRSSSLLDSGLEIFGINSSYRTNDDSSITLLSICLDESLPYSQTRYSSGTSMDKWTCSLCSFKNDWSRKMCEICFAFQNTDCYEDIVSELTKSMTSTWTCKHCTCLNFSDNYLCKQCDKVAPFFHKWICEKCSFYNEESMELCYVCRTINENMITCDGCQRRVANVIGRHLCRPCEDGSDEAPVKDKGANKLLINKVCCLNIWCGTINYSTDQFCRYCKLKTGTKLNSLKAMDVYDGKKFVKKWQCTYCGIFNMAVKCSHCRNMRLSEFYKRCSCNWNNRSSAVACDKCNKALSGS